MNLNRRAFVLKSSFLAASIAYEAYPVRVGAQTPETITIGLLPPSDISAEPFYAVAEGFFRKAGLDVTIEPVANGSAIIAAVVSGHLDVAYSNMISLAIARGRGIETAILSPANLHVYNAPTAGILAVNEASAIMGAKDLNGRLVAVEGLNNIAQIATEAWIDKNGGNSKTVKFVEVTLSAMVAALTAGRVDAAVMNAIYDTTAGKPDDPLRRLCSSTFDAIAPRFAPSVWFTTPRWVAAHKDATLAFIKGMHETAVWANKNRAASAAILAPYTRQTAAEIQSIGRVTYGGSMSPGLIQPTIDVAAKYGLIKASFPAGEMIAEVALTSGGR